jgi:hypothetical protein
MMELLFFSLKNSKIMVLYLKVILLELRWSEKINQRTTTMVVVYSQEGNIDIVADKSV